MKTEDMDYELIKSRLSPCGLHCGKCFAFVGGDIADLCKQLKDTLGKFDIYAERYVTLLNEPVFSKYPEFKSILNYLSTPECKGCRKEKCVLFRSCKVRGCCEIKNVDFCFQCKDFPCDETGFDKHLHKRSVASNRRMREIGIEAYYNEIKDKPRY